MEAENLQELVTKLRASEERFQSFIANSSEHIWCVEFDTPISLEMSETEQAEHILDQGCYVEANAAFATSYGVTPEEVIGWRLERTLPRSLPTTMPLVLEVVRSGYSLTELESCEVAIDGSERIIINNLVGIIKNNRVERVWGTARDVTELRKTEESMRLRSVAIESMRDGCVIVDAQAPGFPIVYANPQFTEMTKYASSDLLGKNCRMLQGADTDAETISEISDAINGESGFQGELLNYRKDGGTFWNFLRLTPVFNSQKVLTHYVGIQSDITRRKNAEILINSKNNDLKESVRRQKASQVKLERLTARIIHAQEEERKHLARELHDDLTQKLAAMSIDASGEASSSEPSADAFLRMSRELSELSIATQELSRQLHPKIIEDLGLVKAIAAECRRFAKRSSILVDTQLDDYQGFLSAESCLCIYRVLQESLSNVLKHADTSIVIVQLLDKGHAVYLSVSDEGLGFDRNNTEKENTLGLVSMAERAVHCGGQLIVESELGNGTTISISLPKSAECEP